MDSGRINDFGPFSKTVAPSPDERVGWGSIFTSRYNPADDQAFKLDVEKLGSKCQIMHYGDEVGV